MNFQLIGKFLKITNCLLKECDNAFAKFGQKECFPKFSIVLKNLPSTDEEGLSVQTF